MSGGGPGPAVEAVALARRWRSARGEVVAVADATLTVEAGAFVAVTGPSGGGKTTLLSLLAGLERPSAGRVRVLGVDLAAASDAERSRLRRRVGFGFQGAPAVRRLAVWENVTLALVPEGVPARARRERAAAALARLGVAALLDERPERLSGGEAQRVGLARALVDAPALVFADEPTAALDAASADAVTRALAEERARGATVIVATHDPRVAALATAAHVMEAGRLRPA